MFAPTPVSSILHNDQLAKAKNGQKITIISTLHVNGEPTPSSTSLPVIQGTHIKGLRTKMAQSMSEIPTGTLHSQSAPAHAKNGGFSYLQGNGIGPDLRLRLNKGNSAPTSSSPPKSSFLSSSPPSLNSPIGSPPGSPTYVRRGSVTTLSPKVSTSKVIPSSSLNSIPKAAMEPTGREMSLKSMLNMSSGKLSEPPTVTSTPSTGSSTNETWSDADEIELNFYDSISAIVDEDSDEPLSPTQVRFGTAMSQDRIQDENAKKERAPTKLFALKATRSEQNKVDVKEPRMKKAISLKSISSPALSPAGKQKSSLQLSLSSLHATFTTKAPTSPSPSSPPPTSPHSTSPPTSPKEILVSSSPATQPLTAREKPGSLSSPTAIPSPGKVIPSDVLTQELRKSLARHPCVDLIPDVPLSSSALRGASFNKLLEWLLIVGDDSDDSDIKAFLCTYRSFRESKDLFASLHDFWKMYCHPQREGYKVINIVRNRLKRRVFTFIKAWLEHWFEFDTEKALVSKIVKFVDSHFASEEGSIFKLLLVKKNFEKQSLGTGRKPLKSFRIIDGLDKEETYNWIMEYSTKDIAEHMTYLDIRSYQAVRPFEFLDCSWTKPGGAPNLQKAVDRFNTISNWVATTIVFANTPDKQALMIKRFISIAKRLCELKNWNGLMQVTSGLGNCAVTRLKQPQKLLNPKFKEAWAKLDHILTPSSNYKTYRCLIKEVPCIPIIAILQRDLTFMYDGNPNYIRGDLLNFEKMKMIGGAINDFLMHSQRSMPSGFTMKKRLKTQLKNLYVLENEQIYQHSLLCEHPTNFSSSNISWAEPTTPSITSEESGESSADNSLRMGSSLECRSTSADGISPINSARERGVSWPNVYDDGVGWGTV